MNPSLTLSNREKIEPALSGLKSLLLLQGVILLASLLQILRAAGAVGPLARWPVGPVARWPVGRGTDRIDPVDPKEESGDMLRHVGRLILVRLSVINVSCALNHGFTSMILWRNSFQMFSTCLWTPCAFWRSTYSWCFVFWSVGLFQTFQTMVMSRAIRVSILATSCSMSAPTSWWSRWEMHHERPSRYNWCRWQLRSVPDKIQVSSVGHSISQHGQGFYKVCIVSSEMSNMFLWHLMPCCNIACGLVWFPRMQCIATWTLW